MKNIFVILLLVTSSLFSQSLSSNSILSTVNTQSKTVEPVKLPPLFPQAEPSKKSGLLAVLYSLVLPGMGELYAGNYETGKYFTIAEGVIWGVYVGYNTYGNWKMNNYKAFASSFGGVKADGKDADFYSNIGDYVNVNDYNRDQGLQGNFDKFYDTQQSYWNWKTEAQRREYKFQWISSEQAYNNLRFAVGALVVNRIVSAFNAARLVRAYNKNIDNFQTGWNISVGVDPNPYAMSNMSLNFQTAF